MRPKSKDGISPLGKAVGVVLLIIMVFAVYMFTSSSDPQIQLNMNQIQELKKQLLQHNFLFYKDNYIYFCHNSIIEFDKMQILLVLLWLHHFA